MAGEDVPERLNTEEALARIAARAADASVPLNLTRANLRGSNLRGANLTEANLTDANLRGANLRGANLTEANLRGADLRGANLTARAYLPGANLRGADLRGAYLPGAYLRGANLRGADLSGAYLRDVDLAAANLKGANLTDADLKGADLKGADLTGAILTRADLKGVITDGTEPLLSYKRPNQFDSFLGFSRELTVYIHPDGRSHVVADAFCWPGLIWGFLWSPLWALSRGFWSKALVAVVISNAWIFYLVLGSDLPFWGVFLCMFGGPWLVACWFGYAGNRFQQERLIKKGFIAKNARKNINNPLARFLSS